MKLLLVGDAHADLIYLRLAYEHAQALGADRVVLLGDVGLGWDRTQFKGTDGLVECKVVHQLNSLAKRSGIPCMVLDGNHENFDWLDGQLADRVPEPDGTVALAKRVHYIPRGTLLDLDGARVLVLGGAVSPDKTTRLPHKSWWPQEDITADDVERAKAQGVADLLLTHDLPFESSMGTVALEEWPLETQREMRAANWRVSEVLEACQAPRLIHGHLHHRYDEVVETAHGPVLVQGLDCNGTSPSLSALLVDTDDLERVR